MKVEIDAPEEFQGSVVGQVNQRRGVILETENREGYVRHRAEVPLNAMFGYSTDLRSRDAGQGQVHHGVRPVRRRAEARAGRDDEEVPREAGSGEEVTHPGAGPTWA